MLGFPWIFLAETGLFNGLQGEKIKKVSAVKFASKVVRHASLEDARIPSCGRTLQG
jgi:hypothetical protein